MNEPRFLSANTREELRRHMIRLADELGEQYGISVSWTEIPQSFVQEGGTPMIVQLTFRWEEPKK